MPEINVTFEHVPGKYATVPFATLKGAELKVGTPLYYHYSDEIGVMEEKIHAVDNVEIDGLRWTEIVYRVLQDTYNDVAQGPPMLVRAVVAGSEVGDRTAIATAARSRWQWLEIEQLRKPRPSSW